MMGRTRSCLRLGALTDVFLFGVLITLAYLLIARRYSVPPPLPAEEEVKGVGVAHAKYRGISRQQAPQQNNSFLIDPRLDKIPESRPSGCLVRKYGSNLPKVSIIIEFFNYQFYDVKTVVASIYKFTPTDLIEEIIIVDDGTSVEYIKDDSKYFAKRFPKVKLIRQHVRGGVGSARMFATAAARTDTLIFMQTDVVCNRGWLQPLLTELSNDGNAIYVPHFDSITDPVSYEYKNVKENIKNAFTWRLTSVWQTLDDNHPEAKQIKPLSMPFMRGNLMVVSRKYLTKMGGFDYGLVPGGGGEGIELSFRIWLCGGSIKVVPCSRVGALGHNEPYRIGNEKNIRRIAELYMDGYKDIAFRKMEDWSKLTDKEMASVTKRKNQLTELKCKNFEWYVKNVANEVTLPSPDVKEIGYLKSKSGMCGIIAEDKVIQLRGCDKVRYQKDHLFEYTNSGQLRSGGMCFGFEPDTYYLRVQKCEKGDLKQTYTFSKSQIKIKPSETSVTLCITHVTDSAKAKNKRQVIMAQDCSKDADKFQEWSFNLI